MAPGELPDEAWLAALAALPDMGPRRLGALLVAGSAQRAWGLVVSRSMPGEVPVPAALAQTWAEAASRHDVADGWGRCLAAGIGVLGPASAAYPHQLRGDPYRPSVLFTRGDPRVLDAPCVAVVGTRRCTRYGRDIAIELGRRLAELGVVVVSGLAAGIDAEAHRGALSAATSAGGAAPVAAVAGTGVDIVYPRSNATLWDRVARTGVLVSESPLGALPHRWRFPARNRIIAALSAAVVVVESHAAGGSLLTAAEALERDRLVVAVPGPIHNASSRGTNLLAADGAQVLASFDDLISVLSLAGIEPQSLRHGPVTAPEPGSAPAGGGLDDSQHQVLEAFGWCPLSFDQLVAAVERPVAEVARAVEKLLVGGLVAQRGRWLERTLTATAASRVGDER